MIGLGFTGGMDSTMLLHELLQSTKDKIVCVTNDIRSRNTQAYKNSAKILEYFPSDRIIHDCMSTWGVDHHRSYIVAVMKYGLKEFYFGTTQIADHILNDTRHTMFDGQDRSDYRGQKLFNTSLHQPYFDLYRTDIIQKYIDYDMIDIMNDTNSCDKLIEKPCGECQACRDREWAINVRESI